MKIGKMRSMVASNSAINAHLGIKSSVDLVVDCHAFGKAKFNNRKAIHEDLAFSLVTAWAFSKGSAARAVLKFRETLLRSETCLAS